MFRSQIITLKAVSLFIQLSHVLYCGHVDRAFNVIRVPFEIGCVRKSILWYSTMVFRRNTEKKNSI